MADKPKGLAALFLGGDAEGEEPSESDAVEMACKAFFKAGNKGDFAKAAQALRDAVEACDEEPSSSEPDDDEDEEDDDLDL